VVAKETGEQEVKGSRLADREIQRQRGKRLFVAEVEAGR
jgi:hypothetical protein